MLDQNRCGLAGRSDSRWIFGPAICLGLNQLALLKKPGIMEDCSLADYSRRGLKTSASRSGGKGHSLAACVIAVGEMAVRRFRQTRHACHSRYGDAQQIIFFQ